MNKDSCRAIMYHYVRDNSEFIPNLKYLHVDDFKRQLDFFEKNYGFIKKADWEFFIENGTKPPKGILLTFDDGLIDHYKFVLPILSERNLWGHFFVNSLPLKGQILNVHKIHYLVGKYNPYEVYNKLIELLDILPDSRNIIDKLGFIDAYKNQSMSDYCLYIKKLNYIPNINIQNYILDSLIEYFNESIETIWKNIYMNCSQIKEIINAGNIVGGHSESHFLLGKLSETQFNKEIDESNQYLSDIFETNINTFCYPYGLNDAYNSKIIERLKKNGIKYSFCVNPRDINITDILCNKYEIPRYDCNLFEFGKCR